MKTVLRMALCGCGLWAWLVPCPAQQSDTIVFGNASSEAGHSLVANNTFSLTGALGQTARRCISNSSASGVYGGNLTFTMNVDSFRRNYVSIKLWGGEDSSSVLEQDSNMGRLYLYVPDSQFHAGSTTNWQIGYRHEGDYIGLNAAACFPPLPGRFFYSTTLLPLWMTQGRTNLTVEIVSAGRIYTLGSGGPPSGNYQFAMITNSRAIYAAYTHVDPLLIPTGETQGVAPTTTVPSVPTESQVLGASGTFTAGVNSYVSGRLSTAVTNWICSDVELLAEAYSISNLTAAYQNSALVSQVITALDTFASGYYANPSTSVSSGGGNENWGGRFGALGWAIHLLLPQIGTNVDATVYYSGGGSLTRRQAWGAMLVASRDYGRLNRNSWYLSNQGLIANANIYKANRGLEDLGNANAFTETNAQRYLLEAIGLQPWLGSDLAGGGSSLMYGTNYTEVTAKGLSREQGYVGNSYGEMQYFAASFYGMTSNSVFQTQAVKMAKARAPFRRPNMGTFVHGSVTNYYHWMEDIGLLAWRGANESDVEFADFPAYGDSSGWSHGMQAAAATLDSNVVGYAKQMINDDNQYFTNLVYDTRWYSGSSLAANSFDGRYVMGVFSDYSGVKAATDSGIRLPMTEGQPDFAWADEDDGIVAVKHGSNRLWLETYWQAKTGTGVNGLGRFYYSTTNYDLYGVVENIPQVPSSVSFYVRPNIVDKPEQNFYVPPDNPAQAYMGERLPLGPNDPYATSDMPFRGKALFWACRYGNYLIGINRDASNTYQLKVPSGFTSATDLVSGAVMTAPVDVGPKSTVVLYLDSVTNSCSVPTPPLSLAVSSSTASNISVSWNASSGSTSYAVKRSTTTGGPYTTIATGITTTNYTDSTVVQNGYYFYVVSGSNSCGESDYNSMETGAGTGMPSPWSDVDIDGVGTAGGASYDGTTFKVEGAGSDIGGTADSMNFAYMSVTNNCTIVARVATIQDGGTLDKVGIIMRETTNANSTLAAVIIDTQLATSRLATRTVTGSSMNWTNGPAVLSPPQWLKLQRSGNSFIGFISSNGVTWTQVGTTGTFSMASAYVAGLGVCSRNTAQLDVSTFDNVTVTPGWSAPAAPTGLSAVGGNQQVALSWSASSGATGYNVKSATISNGTYAIIAANTTSLVFTNTGLSNGTTYYYVVSALDLAGESSNSTVVSATPGSPPAAPANLTAAAGDSQVALSWSAVTNATGYNVKSSPINGGSYATIASVSSVVFTNTGLSDGTTYYYVVTATNTFGESTNSFQVSATPLSAFQSWQLQYFGCTACSQASPNADPLGKGMSNTNQFLAGFNPTNGAAYLYIVDVASDGTNVTVTYLGANGDNTWSPGIASRTNVLEFTAGAGDGSYSNNFASTGQTNILSGGGGLGVVTNMVDSGGATNEPSRYYRVRVLVP
ncbi:MAG TPA: hypothetical protein VMV72_10725 [Verrucomicrobiae bacterium]|nr:hypothetical protein [Verrucomicrobiae bacterium]